MALLVLFVLVIAGIALWIFKPWEWNSDDFASLGKLALIYAPLVLLILLFGTR